MNEINDILRQSVDINFVNKEGLTPLLCLIKGGHSRNDLMDAIRFLLNQEGIDVNCKDQEGWNALYYLCRLYQQNNLVDIIRLLIQHGIDVTWKNQLGQNALLILCLRYPHENLIDIVRLLIENGIDIHWRDKVFCQFIVFMLSIGTRMMQGRVWSIPGRNETSS